MEEVIVRLGPTSRTLTGIVKDLMSSTALKDVTVEIIDVQGTCLKDNNGNWLSAVSDDNGKITILGIPILSMGNYSYARLAASGRTTVIVNFSDADFSENASITMATPDERVYAVKTEVGIDMDKDQAFIMAIIRDSSGNGVSDFTVIMSPVPADGLYYI